jgi:hypothetical protein
MSTDNYFGLGFTDASGAFALRAISSQWQIMWDEQAFNTLGYLTLLDNPVADTTTGNATVGDIGFPKGTALIYGNISDYQGHFQSRVSLGADDGTYETAAISDRNGNYFMPVIAGNWYPWVDAEYSGYTNQVFLPSVYGYHDMTNGDALRIDYTSYPAPFIRQPSRLSASQIGFELIGLQTNNYIVQFSTDLSSTNWSTLLTTNLPYDSAFPILDNQATNNQRFYRAKSAP